MIWILKGCCDECPEGPCADCPDAECKVFDIEVSWPSGYKDLDVCVKYNNITAGYGCTNGSNPQFLEGDDGQKADDTTEGGTEKFRVTVADSQIDQIVDIHCHWYRSLGTDFDASLLGADIEVKVIGCGTTKTVTVITGNEAAGCSCNNASHTEAKLTVEPDGDWTLEKVNRAGDPDGPNTGGGGGGGFFG